MKSHQRPISARVNGVNSFRLRQVRTSTCLCRHRWKWSFSLAFDQPCMFSVHEDIVLSVPWERSVQTAQKALKPCLCELLWACGGRACLFWICDVSHPPQERRRSCMSAVCWGSKSRNNLFGTTELSIISSKLKTNLFLILILSSATKTSWRPMASSVPHGQCWGRYSLKS